jgi:integrase
MKVTLAQYDSRKSHDTAGQLQAILGHHSPTVTMKYYVHVQEGDLCRALNGWSWGSRRQDKRKLAMRPRGA